MSLDDVGLCFFFKKDRVIARWFAAGAIEATAGSSKRTLMLSWV